MQPSLPGNGAYDFLNQPPAKKSGLRLPNLPRPAWILIAVSLGLLLILTILAIAFGGKSANSNVYLESMSYAQEIDRVSQQIKGLTDEPSTTGLAATTTAVMLSNNSELSAYLADSGVKVNAKLLSSREDTGIDKQLQEAASAGRVHEAYVRYLQIYLHDYQRSLQAAYNQSGQLGRQVIQEAFDSVDIILKSPVLAESSS